MSPEFFQQLAGLSVIFYLFLVIGAVWIYQKIQRPILFLILFGTLQGAAYYLLTKGTSLPFWGLVGDEIFISALFEQAAHGGLFQDFAYSHLPPFYPPLFFWVFAPIGNFLSLNGVQLYKLANLVTFAAFPLVFYGFFRLLVKWYPELTVLQSKRVALWSSVLLFFFPAAQNIIHKPYEFTSAALMVLWTIAVVAEAKRGSWQLKRIFFLGFLGGILFMWFYFWLFFAAIAVGLFFLFQKNTTSVKTYAWLFVLGVLVLLCAIPYIYPLVQSYVQFGAENWQSGFSVAERLSVHGPLTDVFSVKSFFMLGICGGLLFFRKKLEGSILLCLYATPFVWQFLGACTIFFFASPLQEAKGFLYVHDAIYAITASLSVCYILPRVQKYKLWIQWQIPIAFVFLWIIAVGLIFGNFRSDPVIHAIEKRAVMSSEEQKLIDVVKQRDPTLLTIHSGVMELYATTPMHSVIYFNQHASHPAAHFSERKAWLKQAAQLNTSAAFAEEMKHSPYGPIKRFIFFKDAEPDHYMMYLHSDGYPNGIKEEGIGFSKALFDSPEFAMILETERYVLFEIVEE